MKDLEKKKMAQVFGSNWQAAALLPSWRPALSPYLVCGSRQVSNRNLAFARRLPVQRGAG